MKKYEVVIELVRGYYQPDEEGNQDPIIERKEFQVEALTESEAIKKAKEMELSNYSIFDSYAEEITE